MADHRTPKTKRTGFLVKVLTVLIAVGAITAVGHVLKHSSSPKHNTVVPSPSATTQPPPLDASAHPESKPAAPKPTKRLATYTVQPGDNLCTLVVKFKLHSYLQLYHMNKAVIGDDPNLLRPGTILRIEAKPHG